jgi:Tol biopolymer transport system component
VNAGTGPVSIAQLNMAFSPDRTRLVYASNELDYVEYGIVNVDGTGTISLGSRNLTEEAFGQGLDWSPRTDQLGNFGNLLVVSSSYDFLDSNCLNTPRSEAALYLVRAVQGGLDGAAQLLTQPAPPSCFDTANDLFPAFSPNGTQVAFVRTALDSNAGVISSTVMAVNLDGSNQRTILYLPGERVTSLSWSPDGTSLIFDRTQMLYNGLLPNPLGIWVTGSKGNGTLVQLLNPPAYAPAWN